MKSVRNFTGVVVSLLVVLSMAAPVTAYSADTTDSDSEQSAVTVLESLPVKGRAAKTGYNRKTKFGTAWKDVDHNGCDTRNDILKRDLTDVKFKSGTKECVVRSGTLADPYTGTSIKFVKGNKTSSAVQIDHVVALSDAWQKGAQQLSQESRVQLANDPYNLLAVDGTANKQKSDSDAASWLPSNKSFRCEYVARQIGVKAKYSLWVTQAEHDAMSDVLSSCPTQTVPAEDGVQTTVKSQSEQESRTEQQQQQQSQEQTQQEQTHQEQQSVQEQTQQQSQQQSDVYYKNCTAARAAGAAPIHVGEPGYARHLDRDGDGVACE